MGLISSTSGRLASLTFRLVPSRLSACLLAPLCLGLAGGFPVSYPASAASGVPCDTWIGGVDNNFGTAGNWSTGFVPGPNDDACITGPTALGDTYTVIANGGFSIHSLTLGG